MFRATNHPRTIYGLFLAGLAACTGCAGAIHGEWHLVRATPSRQVFAVDNAVFRADGTYQAVVTFEGVTTAQEGTYDFDGTKLRVRFASGGQRTWVANARPGQLQINDGDRRVILQRGQRGTR